MTGAAARKGARLLKQEGRARGFRGWLGLPNPGSAGVIARGPAAEQLPGTIKLRGVELPSCGSQGWLLRCLGQG